MTSAAHRSAPVHLDYLDGIRGLAALFVVAHHAYLQVWPSPAGDSNPPALGFLKYGHFSVALFIVLSGYCLMLPVLRDGGRLRKGALNFYRRRFWRIVPPFYAALVLSLVMIATVIGRPTGTHWDICLPVDRQSVLACLLLVQDAWMPYRINHAFWSIATEWRIYFFFPLMVVGFRKLGPVLTTITTAALTGCTLLTFKALRLQYVSGNMRIHFFILFVLGMFAAAIAQADSLQRWGRLRERMPWGMVSLVGMLVVVGSCWYRPDSTIGREIIYRDYIGFTWATLLVYVATPRGAWLARACGWRPIVRVGVIGYSLYLIHAPFLQLIHQGIVALWEVNRLNLFIALVVLGTPIIVFVSYLFSLLFEPRQRRIVEVHALATPSPAAASPKLTTGVEAERA